MGRHLAAAVILASLGAALACTGDDDAAASRSEQGVVDAAEAQWQAIAEGDAGGAYAYLAAECQEATSEEAYAQQLDLLLASLRATVGLEDLSEAELVVEVRRYTDDSADVYSNLERDGVALFPESDAAQVERWVWQEDGWRTSECPPPEE